MNKLREIIEAIKEKSVLIKTFGVLFGTIIVIFFSIGGVVLETEISDCYHKLKQQIQNEFITTSKSGKSDTNKSNKKKQTTKQNEDSNIKLTTESTIEPTEEPAVNTSFSSFKQLNGKLKKGESKEETYVPEITGEYRFDCEIDDVNKEYTFYILDKKEETIASENSNFESGVTAALEAGQEYTLGIKNNDENEDVNYNIVINAPDPVETIDGTVIKNKLKYIDQEKEYTYVAPKSGKYRFDLDIGDVSNEYGFYIYDSKNAEIFNESSSNKGESLELMAGETYKFKVVQREGTPDFTITIGIPNDTKNIKNNKIKDTIKYIDQCNTYTYKALITGQYRFDLDIDDVNKSYHFAILNKKKEVLEECNSSDLGETVELVKGNVYTIKIEYIEGSAKYKVKINVPNKISVVKNNIINGKIKYIDQQDVYNYKPKKSGKFYFNFKINNVKSNYKIYLYDSKNSEVFQANSSDEDYEVSLRKNTKYKICVQYLEGYPKYKIIIK